MVQKQTKVKPYNILNLKGDAFNKALFDLKEYYYDNMYAQRDYEHIYENEFRYDASYWERNMNLVIGLECTLSNEDNYTLYNSGEVKFEYDYYRVDFEIYQKGYPQVLEYLFQEFNYELIEVRGTDYNQKEKKEMLSFNYTTEMHTGHSEESILIWYNQLFDDISKLNKKGFNVDDIKISLKDRCIVISVDFSIGSYYCRQFVSDADINFYNLMLILEERGVLISSDRDLLDQIETSIRANPDAKLDEHLHDSVYGSIKGVTYMDFMNRSLSIATKIIKGKLYQVETASLFGAMSDYEIGEYIHDMVVDAEEAELVFNKQGGYIGVVPVT